MDSIVPQVIKSCNASAEMVAARGLGRASTKEKLLTRGVDDSGA